MLSGAGVYFLWFSVAFVESGAQEHNLCTHLAIVWCKEEKYK